MTDLIRKSLDQIRRDGYANVKAVEERKRMVKYKEQKNGTK